MDAQPSHIDLSRLLPTRAIAVRPPRTVEGGTFGVIALLAVLLLGLIGWLGPSIASDWRMRADAVAAPDLDVRDVQCRSWFGLLRFCGATIAGERNRAEGTGRRVWYAFAGSSSDQPKAAVRSATDPARVATDLGLERVYGRFVALALFSAILVLCIGVAVSIWRRGVAARRAFAGMSGDDLTPVVVEIERNNRLPPRRRLWIYLYDEGGRRERALAEWPSSRQPLFTSIDERWALALRGRDGGTPLLLDVNLESLDLTEAEKAMFHRAVRAAFAPETTVV